MLRKLLFLLLLPACGGYVSQEPAALSLSPLYRVFSSTCPDIPQLVTSRDRPYEGLECTMISESDFDCGECVVTYFPVLSQDQEMEVRGY